MAGQNNLLRYLQDNPYGWGSGQPVEMVPVQPAQPGELTPEQRAQIDRDRIDQSLGPFDFTPGFMTKAGGALGALGGAWLMRDGWKWGGNTFGQKAAAAAAELPMGAAVTAAGAGLGYAKDLAGQAWDRNSRETAMMEGKPDPAIAKNIRAELLDGNYYRPPMPGTSPGDNRANSGAWPVSWDWSMREGRGQTGDLRYPPHFPRIEKSPEELRNTYDQNIASGSWATNRYGIFGGGQVPYDEWADAQRRWGADVYGNGEFIRRPPTGTR